MLQLTAEREARGWSKSRLAREAKMTAPTVGQIESGYIGKPYPSQLEKLAVALEWPTNRAQELLKEVNNDDA
jgi:transcriptional regulator with XRE-family HTH domain